MAALNTLTSPGARKGNLGPIGFAEFFPNTLCSTCPSGSTTFRADSSSPGEIPDFSLGWPQQPQATGLRIPGCHAEAEIPCPTGQPLEPSGPTVPGASDPDAQGTSNRMAKCKRK